MTEVCSLKHWSTQEKYRAYIDERLEKHHAAFRGRRDAFLAGAQGEELESLQSLVLLFREYHSVSRLRLGLTRRQAQRRGRRFASHRRVCCGGLAKWIV